jgi:outer membrane protein OmpA-like peptidoglycan-associated protein
MTAHRVGPARLALSTILSLVWLGAAAPAEAQFTKRVLERIKLKAEERKLQTEESMVSRAAEPADSAMVKVTAPVESLSSRIGGGAGAAVGSLGRGDDAAAEAARIREQLAAGRADLAGVRFPPGSAVLDPESEPSLRALAAALAESPGFFLVRGRPDSGIVGQGAAPLAEARAASVKGWLLANGGPGDRVFAVGDAGPAEGAALVTVSPAQ